MIHDPRQEFEPPEDLRELDRLLRRIRFNPRSSLAPELLGRFRRSEQPASSVAVGRFRPVPLLLTGAAIIAVLVIAWIERPVTIDRCCFDLDGGGETDDGIRVVARRDGRVYRLSIYEDLDRSGSHTAADIMRLDRTGRPMAEEIAAATMSTIRHCCQDLDGGGPRDDGIIVVGTPPDRVVTAAIYELR